MLQLQNSGTSSRIVLGTLPCQQGLCFVCCTYMLPRQRLYIGSVHVCVQDIAGYVYFVLLHSCASSFLLGPSLAQPSTACTADYLSYQWIMTVTCHTAVPTIGACLVVGAGLTVPAGLVATVPTRIPGLLHCSIPIWLSAQGVGIAWFPRDSISRLSSPLNATGWGEVSSTCGSL